MIRTIITKRAINTPVAKFQNPDVSIVYSKENEDLENILVYHDFQLKITLKIFKIGLKHIL